MLPLGQILLVSETLWFRQMVLGRPVTDNELGNGAAMISYHGEAATT